MNGKTWLGGIALPAALVLILVASSDLVDASPGRKDRRKNTDSGGLFDSKNKNIFNNNNQGWGANTGVKKKGGAMKTLKKAAVIGKNLAFFSFLFFAQIKWMKKTFISQSLKKGEFRNFLPTFLPFDQNCLF